MPDEASHQKPKGGILSGCLSVWGLNILQIVSVFVLVGMVSGAVRDQILMPLANNFFGLIQLVYVIPILYWAHRKRSKEYVAGVVIAASATFFLSAVCWWTGS